MREGGWFVGGWWGSQGTEKGVLGDVLFGVEGGASHQELCGVLCCVVERGRTVTDSCVWFGVGWCRGVCQSPTVVCGVVLCGVETWASRQPLSVVGCCVV